MRRIPIDWIFREILQGGNLVLLDRITEGVPVVEYLDANLPKTLTRHADLVMALANRKIQHVEVQSRNQSRMPYRMIMYWSLLSERHGKPIRQLVLYIGNAKMTMPDHIDKDRTRHAYDLVDIRAWKGPHARRRRGRPGDRGAGRRRQGAVGRGARPRGRLAFA